LKILEACGGEETEVTEQHDSAVAFARKEVTREYRSFRRFTQPTGLLDIESKGHNELPGSNGCVVRQVVFQKGIVYEFFRAAFDGFLKLDFNASPKSIVDPSCPARFYSAKSKIGIEYRTRAIDWSDGVSRLDEDLRLCFEHTVVLVAANFRTDNPLGEIVLYISLCPAALFGRRGSGWGRDRDCGGRNYS
jgi:hypothetical protein